MARTARSFLDDITDVAFEVLLHQLDSKDHANLRQVSRSICERTDLNIPHIILRLSGHSNKSDLQKWYQIVEQFTHVFHIQVHITGAVSKEVFELAMQQLSKRSRTVTELHLLSIEDDNYSCASDNSKQARVPTLRPIGCLLTQLQTLVLKGSVVEILKEIHYLVAEAPAGGWPLQSLVLHAQSWGTSMSELHFVNRAFPCLKQLEYKFPSTDDLFMNARGTATTANQRAQQKTMALVAALVNSVMQLKCLQQLMVTRLHDIWNPNPDVARGYDLTPGAVTPAVATAASTSAASAYNTLLTGGVLSSLSAAAAAFSTMDDFGLWLLDQHPKLLKLSIITAKTGWSMSWQKQEQQTQLAGHSCFDIHVADHTSMTTASAASDKSSNISWSVQSASYDAPRLPSYLVGRTPEWRQIVGDGSYLSVSVNFRSLLTHYSSRPMCSLMSYINNCHLTLEHEQVSSIGLGKLLGGLKCLRHLKVSLPGRYPPPATKGNAAAVIAAAAAVPKLQTLSITAGCSQILAKDSLLLPLTAAAGGPYNSLVKLELHGRFSMVTPCDDVQLIDPTDNDDIHERAPKYDEYGEGILNYDDEFDEVCEVRDAATCRSRAAAQKDGLAMPLDVPPTAGEATLHQPLCQWHQALRQFTKLTELVIFNQGFDSPMLDLLVESLPPSLEVLRGSRLNIVGVADSIQEPGGVEHRHCVADSSLCLQDAEMCHRLVPGPNRPQLQSLHLTDCQLSSPRILASQQLRELVVYRTKIAGGGRAAKLAWPNARLPLDLMLTCGSDDGCEYGSIGARERESVDDLENNNTCDGGDNAIINITSL